MTDVATSRSDTHSLSRPGSRGAPHVVIAGAGVAAIEAMIALRELLEGFVGIDLVAPTDEFVYRPLTVAEPFGLAERRSFRLAEIAADHGARLHRGSLEGVDNDRRLVTLRGAPSLEYDALLVAIGARPRSWLGGAIHFAGAEDVARLRGIVGELDRGEVASVVFTAPAGFSWTLPLYELALFTATRLAESGRAEARLTILTPEADPLALFGPAAAQHVRELCADRGIGLQTAAQVTSFRDGRVELASGARIEADRVVALPELEGQPIPGLPRDDGGFVPVDDHCAVRGLPGVYAAGDGIAYPIKQGGLAAQQADAAAQAIAAQLGAAIEPQPFQAKVRGQLLTGLGPTYLTTVPAETGPHRSTVALNPLWWPPSKIAGRYLAPYLANRAIVGRSTELEERPPSSARSPTSMAEDHEEIRRLALTFAESDARHGDYGSALAWLETIENVDGLLSPVLTGKRAMWRARLGSSSQAKLDPRARPE